MNTNIRRFHLSDILSITHGRLVSTRHMAGIYDICNFLTQDELYTHQLPRVQAECKAHLLALHPQLNEISIVTDDEAARLKSIDNTLWYEMWTQRQIAKYGAFLDVTPIPKGIHEYKDPIEEAIEMVGPNKVIRIDL